MNERLQTELDAYASETPDVGERLDFFKGLWDIQEEVADALPTWSPPDADTMRESLATGQPLFTIDAPPLPSDTYRDAVDRILELTAGAGLLPEEARSFLADVSLRGALEELDETAALADVDAFTAGIAETVGASSDMERSVVDFVLTAALTPFLADPARNALVVLGDVDWTIWSSGECPACGTPATIGRIVNAGELEGDVRLLSCPLCRAEWSYDRVRCARCGNRNPEELHYLFEESDPSHRVHVCEACKGYLRVTDERQLGRQCSPQVEDVVSLLMEAVARERGYERLGRQDEGSAQDSGESG